MAAKILFYLWFGKSRHIFCLLLITGTASENPDLSMQVCTHVSECSCNSTLCTGLIFFHDVQNFVSVWVLTSSMTH